MKMKMKDQFQSKRNYKKKRKIKLNFALQNPMILDQIGVLKKPNRHLNHLIFVLKISVSNAAKNTLWKARKFSRKAVKRNANPRILKVRFQINLGLFAKKVLFQKDHWAISVKMNT